MELSSLSSDVTLGGVGQTSGFKMEANEFSFRVLSDGLYQNKIGSMVREVSCNALDSHVQAGKGELPIRLHMPDTFEPYFSVQDFGIGLDDRGVRQTFATYFHSTKRSDNTAIGAFGLGSKTPFAYTDAFTIIAIKDGRKRQYSAFIGENGYPSIANMGGEFSGEYLGDDGETVIDQWDATDEGNGVTIIVPVTSSADFRRFRTEVQNQLVFFTVKPEVVNCDEITWVDWSNTSKYLNIDNVLVGENVSYGGFHGLWIVQGVVGYRADVDLLNQHLSPENREFIDVIQRCAILRFELGEIEVTPSREGVSYTKKTIAAIEKLLDTARANAKVKIQEQIDAFPDYWAAATGINGSNALRRMANITGAGFEAEGYYQTGAFYYLDLERIANIEGVVNDADDSNGSLTTTATSDDEDEGDDAFARSLSLHFRRYTKEAPRYGRRTRKWRENRVGRHAKADNTFIVLVRDTTDKPVSRIREFLSGVDAGSQLFVLQNRDGGPVTADELAQIKARIGESWEPCLLSEVELPERIAKGRPGYKRPTGYLYSEGEAFGDTKEWEREYESLTEIDGAYYATVHYGTVHLGAIDGIVFEMFNAGLLDKPIIAIRHADVKKIADNPNWIPVNVKAQEIVNSVKGNKTMQNALAIHSCGLVSLPYIDSEVIDVLRQACEEGLISKDSSVHRMFKLSTLTDRLMARAARMGYTSIVGKILRHSGHVSNGDALRFREKLSEKMKNVVNPVMEDYPLLPLLNNNWRHSKNISDAKDAIVAYVNAGA